MNKKMLKQVKTIDAIISNDLSKREAEIALACKKLDREV